MESIIPVMPAVISLVLGILILVFPRLLRILIGVYFVVLGVLGLML